MTGGTTLDVTNSGDQDSETDADLDDVKRGLKEQWKLLVGAVIVAGVLAHSFTSPEAAISAVAWELGFALTGLLLLGTAAKWAWETAQDTRTAVPVSGEITS